jgi:hypothetical protein
MGPDASARVAPRTNARARPLDAATLAALGINASAAVLANLDGGDQSIRDQTRRACRARSITSAERSDSVPLILAAG